jgi:hypothetical protein
MSGWTFEVTLAKVTRKTKTVKVRAFSQQEAIENAQRATQGEPWDEKRETVEYDVREIS